MTTFVSVTKLEWGQYKSFSSILWLRSPEVRLHLIYCFNKLSLFSWLFVKHGERQLLLWNAFQPYSNDLKRSSVPTECCLINLQNQNSTGDLLWFYRNDTGDPKRYWHFYAEKIIWSCYSASAALPAYVLLESKLLYLRFCWRPWWN